MLKILVVHLLCLCIATNASAQEWTPPVLPAADLSSLASTTTVYFYNVEADVFVTNGMDWNTNACATRLTAGESAASQSQRCYAIVSGQNVSIRLLSYQEQYISCLSSNAYDVYVDQATAYNFRFNEIDAASHVYTLTNVAHGKLLDLAWTSGGHLTLTNGAGVTEWAFVPETSVTNGSFARYKGRLALYRVYAAIVAAGKAEQYAEEIATAQTTYLNDKATTTTLRTAAVNLFKAAAADLDGPLDVSFLFRNADMAGLATTTGWTTVALTYQWGEYERNHATLALNQSQTVPAGLYDVSFRSLYREDGSGAAPTLTVTAENTVTANVPQVGSLNYLVGNANNNDWTSGESYFQPNGMKSAAQALCHPDARALAQNVIVGEGGRMRINARMTSSQQWLNWQSIHIIYKGTGTQPLRDDLAATIAAAQDLANEGGAGAADLLTAIATAQAVLDNSSSSADTLIEANKALLAAIEQYKLDSVSIDHPLDWSERIANRSFEKGFENWTNNQMQTQTNTSFGLKSGNTYVEKWVGEGSAVGDASVFQTLKDLPLGVYILRVAAQNIQQNSSAKQKNAWLVGNLTRTEISSAATYQIVFTNIEKDANIGFEAIGATGNWLSVDNFELLYAGGTFADYQAELQRYIELAESVLSLKIETKVRTALEAAIAAARAELLKTTADGYTTVSTPLRTLKADAETSATAFARLQAAIDAALAVYGDGSKTSAEDFLAAITEAQAVNDNLGSTQAQMAEQIEKLEKAALMYNLDNATGATPRVTTDPRYVRGAIAAFGRMTVSGVATSNILEQGFCYATHPDPTVLDQRTTKYLEQNGRIYIMDMEPATVYYIRAYCMTKSYRVGYGDVIKMSTLPKGSVTYTYYNNDGGDFHNEKNNNALTEAATYWSNYTSVRGFHVTANYSAGTPTADCGYGGNMRIGPNGGQRTGTVMHEMNHGTGGGTIPIWGGFNESPIRTSVNGDWAGERANAVLRFWENREDLVITAAYDGAHWGFRPFSGVYDNGGGSTAIWENKYAFNGAHLEPGAWAGPKDGNGTQIVFIGNSLINQGMWEDGLIPVNYYGGAFCLPAYVFPQDDEVQYYIKNENSECGLYDSYLIEGNGGRLEWKVIDQTDLATTANATWYVSFTPSNQYYQIRNASTGHYLSFTAAGTNGYSAINRSSVSNNENFHLIRGRNAVTLGGNSVRSYWLIHPEAKAEPNVLAALPTGQVAAQTLNFWDAGTNQRWIFLEADEIASFEDGVKKQYQADLRDLIAQIRKLKRVGHKEDVANADDTLEGKLKEIEALSRAATTAGDVRPLVTDARTAAMTFLSSVTPTDLTKPFDLTFMIDNAAIDTQGGWSDNPFFSFSCFEYYERTFDIYQKLTNMPRGTYKLQAQAFQRPGDYATVMSDYDTGRNNVNARLYIGSESKLICHIAEGASATSLNSGDVQAGSQSLYIPDNMESAAAHFRRGLYENEIVSQTTTPGQTLTVGLRSTVSGTRYWTIFDNFRLLFYGSASTDIVTSVDDIIEHGKARQDNHNGVYNLQGQRVGNSIEGLPSGIYIVGGRKVLVK